MADNILIEQSTEIQGAEEPFVKKEIVYVVDQNNGNYNGTIQIDSSSLSNSGKYISLSEAYLEIPLVVTLSADTAGAQATFNGLDLQFITALKNGFHQLIHSISVEYNNTSVVQLTSFTNFFVSFKLMTSLSQDDVAKFGQSIGFYPDSSLSYSRDNNIGDNDRVGAGVRNNANGEGVDGITWDDIGQYNKGMRERQKSTAFTLNGRETQFITAQTAGEMGKNYYVAGTNYKVWYIMAKVQLKHLHDFFAKMPLVRGGYIRMIINTNTAQHTIRMTSSAGGANIYTTSNIITGGTSPLMFASGFAGDGADTLVAGVDGLANGNYDFTLRLSIGRDTTLNLTHPTFGAQTRLYVPIYTMSPFAESNYLELAPTKQVVYQDIYSYQTNVDAGSTFNVLLSNGIPGIKYVVVIPILQASANPVGAGGTTFLAPHQSCFASEPGTTSPLIPLRNFNIQISGQNLFVQNQDYDFAQFTDELASINALNGGLVNGLTSGLISETDFQHMYRYYVGDASRMLKEESALPKSVVITGVNKCALAITLFTFIVFERKITVKTEDGSLVSN